MEKIKGLIIIAHSILMDITESEILASLPEEWTRAIPCKFCEVQPLKINHGEAHHSHFREMMSLQRKSFEEKVAPVLDEFPEYMVVYAGAAPIPLAIHLGYLFKSWKQVHVLLKDHKTRTWKWPEKPSTPDWKTENLPQETIEARGEVVIRFETSGYEIDLDDVRQVVSDPLKNVSFFPDNHDLDPFGSSDDIMDVANDFQKILNVLTNKIPKMDSIHLFASVQCGVAFLIGTKIQPNVHPPVYVYHYHANNTPSFEEAFFVQEVGEIELVIGDKKRKQLVSMREMIADHLESQIKPFVQELERYSSRHSGDRKNPHWFETLFPDLEIGFMAKEEWKGLAPIWNTNLPNETVFKGELNTDSDRFYVDGEWKLNDRLLFAISSRISDESELLRAVRLFFFHESLHYKTHKLTPEIATNIGNYPKIVERADFESDVYALLHEYSYSRARLAAETKDVSSFFAEMIRINTETMWSFDQYSDPAEMQVRRINRYLIWYFLLIQIEDVSCSSLEQIIQLLSNQPLIEIKGLRTKPRRSDGRFIALLNGFDPTDLGIAVFHKKAVWPFASNKDHLPLDQVLQGFKEHNSEIIISALRSIRDLLK